MTNKIDILEIIVDNYKIQVLVKIVKCTPKNIRAKKINKVVEILTKV